MSDTQSQIIKLIEDMAVALAEYNDKESNSRRTDRNRELLAEAGRIRKTVKGLK
jgi:hypothetical protein